MTTTAIRFQVASFTARAVSLGLAVVVSFTLLASMGHIANQQVDEVLLAQAQGQNLTTQVVVVSAHRLPRG